MSRSRAATRKRARMYAVIAGLAMLGIATALVLVAMQDNITFFFGPSEVAQKAVEPGQTFRLGGLVAEGSVEKAADGVTTRFKVTDLVESVPVTYSGVLPDLFREKQGVVALGQLNGQGVFVASEVLAKHDEKYMPPEAVEAMKRAGTWRHAEGESE
ncbi:cytochrome c maturation protein CcmE [Aestuariispira ectoiniformans]|uniref:cytochrome c maturation protein CcmE n=1 Tax=Aestuariispira ectoiniformans TaxID=2775080 RepID=UPI00223BBD97|nr:cytochrome c maturation protein CcmE [Aestuariispira ectoiniformans]